MESTVSKNTEFLSSTDKDIDEYLMRDSPVNFRERLYPTKEKDIVCDSEDLKQKLLGIEEKYIKKKNDKINQNKNNNNIIINENSKDYKKSEIKDNKNKSYYNKILDIKNNKSISLLSFFSFGSDLFLFRSLF